MLNLMNPIVRSATRSDIIAFRGEPWGQSFRCVVAELDGEILGVAGIIHSQPLQVFSSIIDKLQDYPKTIILMIREVKAMMKLYNNLLIIALVDSKRPTSTGLLEHMGFEKYREGIYRWPIQPQ